MKTSVVNIDTEPCDYYIGRPSPFGNPFRITRATSREEAVSQFRQYFLNRLEDPKFVRSVEMLRGKKLGCHCKPLACHGDVIVEWLEKGRLV